MNDSVPPHVLAKSFLCLMRNAKTSSSTGICPASSKNGESLKMRFFIAAVVAFATMTFDFESFKLNHGLHGMARGAFTVAAGPAGEGKKGEASRQSVGDEGAAPPVGNEWPPGGRDAGSADGNPPPAPATKNLCSHPHAGER